MTDYFQQPHSVGEMKGHAGESSRGTRSSRGERGASIVELLIMLAMVTIIVGYALMRITGAQQFMRMENASRLFISYVEKARLDSVRRHAGPPGALPQPPMSYVQITGARTYNVVMDFDGDGNVDAPRNITIPPDQGVFFNTGTTPLPITIAFNWRGRAVNAAVTSVQAVYVSPPAFTMQTTADYGTPGIMAINLSASGESSLMDGNTNLTPPNPVTIDTNVNSNHNIRSSNMQITGY
jgi:type II secretory pathway pseudopilin PulG